MVKFIKIGLRLGVVIIVLLMIYGGIILAIEMSQSKSEDHNLEYFSVIDDIKISENRATPSFLINNEWKYLGGYGRSIISFIQPGDSIAKAQGQDKMVVYRKSQLGRYEVLKEVEL